jgi:undecaprenyl diphosphate synthase
MSDQKTAIPQHVGLIIDGNRRWAKEHGLDIIDGHRQGYLNLKVIALAAMRRGVRYLSAFVFSTENWKRDRKEVNDLMKLLGWILRYEIKQLHNEGIRIRIIGSRLRLGAAMVRAILRAEELTKDNTRGTLLLCLDYGGQQEIVEAVKRIAASGIDAEDITPELITHHLYASDVPEPDLIIRTSGEQRLSNFLLWGSAYSELAFSKKYWPDFNEDNLRAILDDYATRHRRFGR